jgi:hypothetical protein
MRISDAVPGFMTFLRCNPNHHSFGFVALPQRGVQHAAFDLSGRAELSEAIIHLGCALRSSKSTRLPTIPGLGMPISR